MFFKFNKLKGLPQAVKTITGVKPSAVISEATRTFKNKIEQTKKAVKKGTDDFRKQNPESLITDKQAKEIGKETAEKYNKKDRKEFLRTPKRKGGRIGFSKGTGKSGVPAMDIKTKISLAKKKKKNNKGDLGMQSVKYGLDKNPNITAADPKAKFIAANKKNKKKVI
tara:strand:- start:58 stop:558 length:501 start_codon:yes stop_codon:yes gene_type:complete